MKCKECGNRINLTTDNLMMFDYETFFKCDKCQTDYSEEEFDKELEKVYWEGRSRK